MTFSDKRIVDLVNDRFIPVWESVSPVRTAVFDLGDGKSVKGTVGGEIAIYFCRPDGKVFDILPALQSPRVTLNAIRAAADFYAQTQAKDDAVFALHRSRPSMFQIPPFPLPTSPTNIFSPYPDRATAALTEMSLSKTGMVTPTEHVTVVEPGGLDLYRGAIARHFAVMPLCTPRDWIQPLFVGIFHQRLGGGEERYDPDSLEPLSLIDD